MRKLERHHRIFVLMLISTGMLLAFVVIWLLSQYEKEKSSLQENLSRYYAESQGELLDTLLVEHLIIPHLDEDSLGRIMKMRKDSYVMSEPDTIMMELISDKAADTSRVGHAMISVSINDTGMDVFRMSGEKDALPFDLDEVLIRSARLFFHYQDDTASETYRAYSQLKRIVDTSLFKKIYDERLENDGYKLIIEWRSDSLPHSSHNKGCMIVANEGSGVFPVAMIKNYRIIIIKNILPQIIFALILLIITAYAFFLAYYSLRKQLMLNTLRKDFISNITHELKTPVSTVKVAVEAMQREDIEKNTKLFHEYLKMSSAEIQRLENLIDKTLKHSILEDHAEFLVKEKFDLNELIKKTLISLEPRFRDANATVNFNDENGLIIDADYLYCQAVIVNILDNSLKYAGPDPYININIEKQDEKIILRVSDKGPGIPDKYHKRVFDKFFRIPDGDRHNVKGYGLGLSFAFLVMQHHKGSIEIMNLAEGGCSFSLIFPDQGS